MMGFRNNDTSPDTTPRKIEFSKEDMEELDKSQFGEFRRVIMGSLDPTFFACLFSAAGRPSSPVDLVLGIMILACFLGVSEDSILKQLKGNIYYQYALCMDAYSYVIPSKRTFIRMRTRIILNSMNGGEDVFHKQAVSTLQKLAFQQQFEGNYFRMDSVMLNIYAKQLNRAQLIYYVIQGLVLSIVETSKSKLYKYEKSKNLKIEDINNPQKVIEARTMRHELADKLASEAGLPKELWHYLYMDDYNSKFYQKGKSNNVSKEILEDAALVWGMYHVTLANKNEFRLFARVLRDQCDWVGLISRFDRDSEVTQTVKRVLRFKLSKDELNKLRKSRRDLANLEAKELKLRRKNEKAAANFAAAKKKAIKAAERAEKAKTSGSAKYESFAAKAKDLAQTADELGRASQNTNTEYEEILETLGAELRLREAKDTYVEVDYSMEDEVNQMNSDILQSPVDTWATFCEKAGKYFRGYKVCIIEVADGKGHSLPVEWITVQNNVSDALAGASLIQQLGKLYPDKKNKMAVADGSFAGAEIDAAAKEANVEVINTDLSGQKTSDHLADFEFNTEGTQISKCAGGQSVNNCSCSKDGMVSGKVNASECAKCQYFKACNPTIKGEKATVKASAKQKARALFQRSKGSDSYTAIGRFRNGIEAHMNLFKRKSLVTRQPIYGLYRVSFYNDVAMIVCGFSKYLAQKNIPHEEPNINGDYTALFPEDEADVESARMEIERDLHRAAEEQGNSSERDFMSPMVIPQPIASENTADSEQVNDKIEEVEDIEEAEEIEKAEKVVEVEPSAEAEVSKSESGEDIQPDSDSAEADANIPVKQYTGDEHLVDEDQNIEENGAKQECSDVDENESRGAQKLDLRVPPKHASSESTYTSDIWDSDTWDRDVLRRILQGAVEIFPSKRSNKHRGAEDVATVA